jgi:transcriptional regulator GlxA family with amidase domain
MLEHLRMNGNSREMTSELFRFLQVVVDLLAAARRTGTYLPWSEDRHLQPILSHLERNPQDNRALAEFARLGGTTERTLIRRSMRDLGMPFAEWKQRLRVIKAMPLLEGSETIERISSAMGYGSASAFIAMFKRMTGLTPEEYRASAR